MAHYVICMYDEDTENITSTDECLEEIARRHTNNEHVILKLVSPTRAVDIPVVMATFEDDNGTKVFAATIWVEPNYEGGEADQPFIWNVTIEHNELGNEVVTSLKRQLAWITL